MNNININDQTLPIKSIDYKRVCDKLSRRIKRILYLKDDVIDEIIDTYDINSYINALTWDLYGCYVTYEEFRFLNCITELEGIKENLFDDFARKKILDLANFVLSISDK